MADEKAGLNDVQRTAAILLFRGTRPGVVAETVGVSPSIISRWKRKPEFRAYLDELFDESRSEALQRVRGLGKLAVDQLELILKNPKADPHAKLKAIGLVFQTLGINPKTVLEVSGPGGGPIEVETQDAAKSAILRLLSGQPAGPVIDVQPQEEEPQEAE